MNLKENAMEEVNSWRFWWVLRVLGRYLKRRNKRKCFGHLEENWIFEIFETKSVASMLQHWAHNVAASEMEENWQNSQCCSIEDSMTRHSGGTRKTCRSTADNFDLFVLWGPKHDFQSGIWGSFLLQSCRGLKNLQFHIRIGPKIRSFTLSKACSKFLVGIWVVLGDWCCTPRSNCDFDIVKGRIRVFLFQTKLKITSKFF